MGVSNASIVITPNPILEDTDRVAVKETLPAAGKMWSASFLSQDLHLESETRRLTERGPVKQLNAINIPLPPPPSLLPLPPSPIKGL